MRYSVFGENTLLEEFDDRGEAIIWSGRYSSQEDAGGYENIHIYDNQEGRIIIIFERDGFED